MDTIESNIIPFPVKARQAETEPQVRTPLTKKDLNDRRLRKSLERLQESVEEQKKVVASYRDSIKDLKESIHGLRDKVIEYDRRVNTLDIRPLGRKARRLYRIMDNWEAGNAASG